MSSERYGSSESKDTGRTRTDSGRSEKSGPRVEEGRPRKERAHDETKYLHFDDLIEGSEASANAISELLEASSAQKNADLKKSVIDEELIANLGSGMNDYGVLEELLPPIDFSAIPLTQPKRVQAKSDPNSKDVLPDNEGRPNKMPPKKASKRKKKPASLLDSYFKGL